MKISAILFDMIGTTVQEKTKNTIRDCFKLAFKKYGVQPSDQVIKANRGKDKMVMITNILQKDNHPLDLAPSIFKAFQENINASLSNFSGSDRVEELFDALRKKGIKIGLGTGLPRDQFDKIMDHLGWEIDDFQYIGISSELGRARPDPVMILDMMKVLGVSDKKTFLKVGDTRADIEEGRNAGVQVIGILSGTQPKGLLAAANPDLLIENIIEVLDFING